MCGRFNLIDDQFTRSLLAALEIPQQLETRYNIAPGETVAAIRQTGLGRECRPMRWWLVPRWVSQPGNQYAMFNARMETLAGSRAFREPFRHQRCIIPASSFIEWRPHEGRKQPYLIRARDRALAFAGLWERWERGDSCLYSCTIITTEAVAPLRRLHRRMPVMLSDDGFGSWLDPDIAGEDLLPLLRPALPSALEACPVEPWIGNSRRKQAPVKSGESLWLGP